MNTKNRFFQLLVSLGVPQLAGVLGSLFTFSEIPTWYASLAKPALNPPSWIFGPVWTTLYVLMGLGAFLVWRRGWGKPAVRHALTVFLFQLILNSLWSIIFFGLHNPCVAFFELVLMWLAILWTIIHFAKISRPAAYLLLPYLAWVTFAGYLNYSLWILN